MRIVVSCATGRIGARLTRALLGAGHEVTAMSRGGPALDALVAQGARPFLGSFDTGTGDLDTVFEDADAAFLMVKTDWNDLHGHYPKVARRFVDALRRSRVKRAVNLTAIGADAPGITGHFECFRHLEQALDSLDRLEQVHLRAGWFMENLLAWTHAVARHGRIGWSLDPDVKLPWVATADIAGLAAHELMHPTGQRRVIREVGSEDLTMPEVATIVGREIGRSVTYRFVDRRREDVRAAFLQRAGDAERWVDHNRTLDALNDRRVRFHGVRPPLPTTMAGFVRDAWTPRYLEAQADRQSPDSYPMWSSQGT